MSKPLGVVQVLMAGEAVENGLREQSGQGVPPILTGAGVDDNLGRPVRHLQHVVEFAMGELRRPRSRPNREEQAKDCKLQLAALENPRARTS